MALRHLVKPYPIDRRTVVRGTVALIAAPVASVFPSGCSKTEESQDEPASQTKPDAKTMKIHYLEIVTPNVDAAVALHTQLHGVTFSAPAPNFGGAKIAELDGGGLLGIRAPLRDTEEPVVRPYYLVDNIEEAVASASRAGAEIAMTPTEIPGSGKFAIFIQGGIETGLWQVSE